MTYERPRPMLSSRHLDILKCLAPLGVRRTRAEIVSALGGCCAEAVAIELRKLVGAGMLDTARPAGTVLQYTLTAAGAAALEG